MKLLCSLLLVAGALYGQQVATNSIPFYKTMESNGFKFLMTQFNSLLIARVTGVPADAPAKGVLVHFIPPEDGAGYAIVTISFVGVNGLPVTMSASDKRRTGWNAVYFKTESYQIRSVTIDSARVITSAQFADVQP